MKVIRWVRIMFSKRVAVSNHSQIMVKVAITDSNS